MTVFFRVLDVPVSQKPEALLRAVSDLRSTFVASDGTVFVREPEAFAAIPGSPFAYWATESMCASFKSFQRFEAEGRIVRQGLSTADDFRFVRISWELPQRIFAKRWFAYAKGGSFSPLYADVFLCVNWENDGEEAKAWAGSLYGGSHWSRILKNTEHYCRPGLTWPRRTQAGFGIRAMPAGCIFADKGPAAFVEGDSPKRLLALLALATSTAFRYFVELQMAFGSYEVGVIQRTPVPDLSDSDSSTLARLGHRAWSLKRSLDMANETSHAFLLPNGVGQSVARLDRGAIARELESVQEQIDHAAFALYGISLEDRAAIEAATKYGDSDEVVGEAEDDEGDGSDDEEEMDTANSDAVNSWLVGIAFGRFDPRIAAGERPIPPDPEPFDTAPLRAPGMWPESEEPSHRSDILVDDEGHADDIVARVRASADSIQVEVSENLRTWIAKEFFPLHIRMYSKSRRKAPIYWQLATPSASYSVWLYIHAFNNDTLYRMQNDYIAPKLAHEERRLETLTFALRDNTSAAQRKELAAQQYFVEELRNFQEEVKIVAPLWNPNLDDGVILNFAPLWRLVPQHKAWQKDLKAAWDALCGGKYDWSHLAMHLWPERVVPKCSKDRSLAIAHDLDEVLWSVSPDRKYAPRKNPTKSLDELVRERTSPAVKAALKNLLNAPTQGGAKKASKKVNSMVESVSK